VKGIAIESTIDSLVVGANVHIYVPPVTFRKKTNMRKELVATISLNVFARLKLQRQFVAHYFPVQGAPREWTSDPDNISSSNVNRNFIFYCGAMEFVAIPLGGEWHPRLQDPHVRPIDRHFGKVADILLESVFQVDLRSHEDTTTSKLKASQLSLTKSSMQLKIAFTKIHCHLV
jgi:hypothetical protein